jgi:chromosome segregation ATPase
MTTAALTEELRLVEEDLARLRKTAADLRRRIGDRDEEPTDAAERSALIEAAEEQEALIDQLEARREQLLRRLGRLARGAGWKARRRVNR